jgi:hypothetical protein
MIRVTAGVQWHGTRTEALELVEALGRHCACVLSVQGVRETVCAPHEMLCSDQRALDGLLFSRRIASRLRREEFRTCAAAADVSASSKCDRQEIGT